MNKIRLFVAIDIDDEGLAKLSSFQESIKKGLSGVRWTDRSTWHITLKFMGEQDKSLLDSFIAVLETATSMVKPFMVTLRSTNAFPNPKMPRVLFVNVEPDTYLTNLYSFLENNFTQFGVEKEKRAFAPHITLGRIKEPHGFIRQYPDFMDNFLKSGTSFKHTFMVSSLCLYQSILNREGPTYIPVRRFNF